MLAAVNRRVRIQDFLKEFSVKVVIYAVANAWKDDDKSTLTNAWLRLWPTTMFDVNEPTHEYFEWFHVTDEKKMISNLVTYAKSLSDKSVIMLDEADIE